MPEERTCLRPAGFAWGQPLSLRSSSRRLSLKHHTAMTKSNVTGKVRGLSHVNKRDDVRPNPKVRKEQRKLVADAQTADDLRVTKKQKADRVEREVDTTEPLSETTDQRAAKKIKALNKKLTAIEVLREKQKRGETLDEKQLAKIDSLGETLELLDDFIAGRRT
jgi:uncharacterized protein with WD repeat